jgi:hypothetical protein
MLLPRFAAALLILLISTTIFAENSHAQQWVCPPGTGECPDGSCAPLGSICCGNGRHAPAGSVCCSDGRHCPRGHICLSDDNCLATSSPRVCSNGRNYCEAGFICTRDSKCLSVESDSYCGGREYCTNGGLCTNEKECLSSSSERNCGNGRYCDHGSVCVGDGKCAPKTAAAPPPSLDTGAYDSDPAPVGNEQSEGRGPAGDTCGSDISGLPGSSSTSAPCPKKSPANPKPKKDTQTGVSTGDGTDSSISCSGISGVPSNGDVTSLCLKQAGWTAKKPYNQGESTLVFKTLQGISVKIPPGYSLWSIQKPSGGRRLEARPWSGDSKSGNCATEERAEVKEFEVNIQCEIGRQDNLRQRREQDDRRLVSREDTSNYVDSFNCRPPWRPEYLSDWKSLPAKYWKDNPDVAVGECVGPERNGRRDVKKLREPGWLTANMCEILHPREPIVVNKRGVRGCYVPQAK